MVCLCVTGLELLLKLAPRAEARGPRTRDGTGAGAGGLMCGREGGSEPAGRGCCCPTVHVFVLTAAAAAERGCFVPHKSMLFFISGNISVQIYTHRLYVSSLKERYATG